MPISIKNTREIASLYTETMKITQRKMGQTDLSVAEHAHVALALITCPEEQRPPLLARLREFERNSRRWSW